MSLAREIDIGIGAARKSSADLLIDALPAAVVMLSRGGRILHGNTALSGMCQVSRDRMVGKRLDGLFNCTPPNSLHRAVLNSARERTRPEVNCVLPVAGMRTLQIAARFAEKGRSYPLIAIVQDVTDDRASERNRAKLQMAELAHRVKNSLQILASSVAFQQRRESAESRDGYRAVHRRILAIASLYDAIAHSGERDEVDGRELMLSLADNLRKSLLDERSGIEILVDARSWPVPPRSAEAIGLIVNELATNAIKHGFASGVGVLRLRLSGGPDGLIVEVIDNGCGIAPGHQPGVGSAIVKSLVLQLHAQIVRKSGDEGTSISLIIPSPASPGSPS